MRFQFIGERRDDFPVRDMCKALNVSPSGYYAWRTRPVSAREMANQQLIEKISTAHTKSLETYGSPRIYHELKVQGVTCSENRVARLMRLYHIQAKQVKCYKVTTKRNQAHPVAPNLLKRDLSPTDPIASGQLTSRTSQPKKGGCTWL
jgi:putative transposase